MKSSSVISIGSIMKSSSVISSFDKHFFSNRSRSGLDSRSSKRSESGAGLFPSLCVSLEAFLLLLRPRDFVTALRGDEMIMDSVSLAAFLLALLGSLEGVLKALGTAEKPSWTGFTLDLSDAVENMAARLVAGVRTSLESLGGSRGVATFGF